MMSQQRSRSKSITRMKEENGGKNGTASEIVKIRRKMCLMNSTTLIQTKYLNLWWYWRKGSTKAELSSLPLLCLFFPFGSLQRKGWGVTPVAGHFKIKTDRWKEKTTKAKKSSVVTVVEKKQPPENKKPITTKRESNKRLERLKLSRNQR